MKVLTLDQAKSRASDKIGINPIKPLIALKYSPTYQSLDESMRKRADATLVTTMSEMENKLHAEFIKRHDIDVMSIEDMTMLAHSRKYSVRVFHQTRAELDSVLSKRLVNLTVQITQNTYLAISGIDTEEDRVITHFFPLHLDVPDDIHQENIRRSESSFDTKVSVDLVEYLDFS